MAAQWADIRAAQSAVQFNRELTVFRQVVKLAAREGLVRDDPLRFIERKKERPRTRYVTDDEFRAVFVHANACTRAAMFLTSITGLRSHDIRRLTHEDFREDGLHVMVKKTHRSMIFKWTDGLRHAYALAPRRGAYWLCTRLGRPFTPKGFTSNFVRAMAKARTIDRAMPSYTFHDLRAKAGTEARNWRLLGHLDQRTFERVYNRKTLKVRPTR
jgi:hypothetical protein